MHLSVFLEASHFILMVQLESRTYSSLINVELAGPWIGSDPASDSQKLAYLVSLAAAEVTPQDTEVTGTVHLQVWRTRLERWERTLYERKMVRQTHRI
jgi:hypothetical protein